MLYKAKQKKEILISCTRKVAMWCEQTIAKYTGKKAKRERDTEQVLTRVEAR